MSEKSSSHLRFGKEGDSDRQRIVNLHELGLLPKKVLDTVPPSNERSTFHIIHPVALFVSLCRIACGPVLCSLHHAPKGRLRLVASDLLSDVVY